MDESVVSPEPTLTDHDRGAAQTPEQSAAAPPGEEGGGAPRFDVGPLVTRAGEAKLPARDPDHPLYRSLRIFTRDPTASSLEGAIATLKIPYEPLADRGPKGLLFHIVEREAERRGTEVNLDDPKILMSSGLDPSPANPQFHQQMLYAICTSVYSAFRIALGRHVIWGFEGGGCGEDQMALRIVPHVAGMRNAFYDHDAGEIQFGYYKATKEDVSRGYLPGRYYTCVSHDIVAHEVTHALLDGLRAHFMQPTSIEVLAFHEAFADLVAIFQHFSYDEMLRAAIRESRGRIQGASLLTDLASEFGHTNKLGGPLRSVGAPKSRIEVRTHEQPVTTYDPNTQDRYALGSVLVSAVFEAFTTVFRRKTARLVRLATGGSGVLPPGELHIDLIDALAQHASSLASQFLRICIRAIDYCPPVDIRFGEYLRAMITADFNLVPDDPYAYREALVDAFRMRSIFPDSVEHLSQDELRWRAPNRKLDPIAKLDFGSLQFSGDPQNPASTQELYRQASVLGDYVTRPHIMDEFGLTPPGAGVVDLPRIESIRSSRRAGPDGQVLFDLVAEVVQRQTIRRDGRLFDFYGGSTIIIDPFGQIRYVISKSLRHPKRLESQANFLADSRSAGLWQEQNGKLVAAANFFQLLDEKS